MSEISEKAVQWKEHVSMHADSEGKYYLSPQDVKELQNLFSQVAALTKNAYYRGVSVLLGGDINRRIDASVLIKALEDAERDLKE